MTISSTRNATAMRPVAGRSSFCVPSFHRFACGQQLHILHIGGTGDERQPDATLAD